MFAIKKSISILNILTAFYFLVLAVFFFMSSSITIFVSFIKQELLTNLWPTATSMLFVPFLIYGAIIFFRKKENKYTYGLILLFIIWAEAQAYRFFFVTNNRLETADLSNLLFFGTPFVIIYLTKYLHQKIDKDQFSLAPTIIILIVVAALVGGYFTWQYLGARQLSIEQIKNAEIYADNWEKVRLVDGKYERENSTDTVAIYVGIDYKNIVFGDLDNDGINEAIFTAYWSGGGSGTWRVLTVLKNINNKPVFIASKDLGDRTIVNSLTINLGIITVDMIVHGSSDAMCCPTVLAVKQYELFNNQLIELKDKTADWKTYKNEEYEFEFKYPENWTAAESVSPGYPQLVFVTLGRQETIQQGGLFGMAVKNQTEAEYFSSLEQEKFYIISKTDTSLGNRKAIIYTFGRTDSPGIQWKEIIAPKDNFLIDFSRGATQGYDDIFNQMLSTFRFLE